MAKDLEFNEKARAGIKQGVDKLASAVKSTLGPRGRNVVIEKEYGEYHSTKDGVTVAKEVVLEDPLENAGAQIVKEVAYVKTILIAVNAVMVHTKHRE